ncbi:rhomboid family intramembrane serine protease [Asticcacaulis sp. AC402]|uniref:rhomboid family intramembrane serine protease n=1 Tax=Asticcacaulis sp. AC402 TaxID=1282361 RepID=UPI0003C3B8E7|nr:rhomboid family intramembrane serine protease [Asticcacaulis sp. AC402]ESQ73837.1 hypothetical protein ABAC402_17475 [Asticcacaulis sp. AC402]
MFTAPFQALILPLILLALFGVALVLNASQQEMLVVAFGLNPLLVRQGHAELLFSYAFLHGDVIGAGMNAALLLAFSVPLMNAFGRGWRGFISFLLLFELLAVAAALAFCLLYVRDNVTVIGASAAVSGVMGAAVRLPWQPPAQRKEGEVLKILHPQVLVLTALVVVYNVALMFIGDFKGQMAWESHLMAYGIGLVLIEPWLRLFHRQYFTAN